MRVPLCWARGDRCLFKGIMFRVAYVTMDHSVALIVRGPDAIMVDVQQLDLVVFS